MCCKCRDNFMIIHTFATITCGNKIQYQKKRASCIVNGLMNFLNTSNPNEAFFMVVVIFLVVINAVTFCVYGIDKWKAKKSKWRVSEATLLGLAVVGGSVGAWLGMSVWHHKTMHKKFKYGIPAIIVIQLALAGYLLYCHVI